MKRDLSAMAERAYDVLIVGGGVCGLSIARDAAMRGLSVALVERDDFAHATSAASSKLIHGGLRYLKTFELSLVRESLRERRIWELVAPHLVYPLRFLVPNYKRPGSSKRWMLRAGLTLYDMLAYDRNRLDDDDRKIPGHEVLSVEQALKHVPGLNQERLLGAVEYWDCQMFAPERLALECALDADAKGADLANWATVTEFKVEDGRVLGAVVQDRLEGGTVEIHAKAVVNAAGPWADRLLGMFEGKPSHALIRSKGIHVITRELTGDVAVAFEGTRGHFFILPWRGHSLIGTTDAVYKGDPDDFAVTEADIQAFLEVINQGFPSAALTREDVVHFYGGLRPLVESSPGEDSYSASRRAEVVDHARTGGPVGLYSALGGKWTTARAVAEQVVDRLVATSASDDLRPCQTQDTALPGGGFGAWAAFLDAQSARHPSFERAVVEHLARNYGSRMDAVIALATADPELAEPIASGRLERRAEIVFAVRSEMARSLADVIFRRTGIGTLGDPGPAALQTVAETMSDELGWTDAYREEQLALVRRRFVPAVSE